MELKFLSGRVVKELQNINNISMVIDSIGWFLAPKESTCFQLHTHAKKSRNFFNSHLLLIKNIGVREFWTNPVVVPLTQKSKRF